MNNLWKKNFLYGRRSKLIVRFMKIYIVIMVLGIMHVSAAVNSQNISVSLKNATLKEVIKEIEKYSEYSFLYQSKEVNGIKNLSVSVKNSSIRDILDICLKGTSLKYEFDEKLILIKRYSGKKGNVYQQEKHTVRGVVVDKAGSPLPGVSVIVKGSNVGVATDVDGKFEIKLEAKKGITLVFSFIGMKTKEIVYNGQTNIKVVLADDSEELEEVVVTGIQTIEKGRATGSFSVVKAKELDKIYSTDLRAKLEGSTPGLLLDKNNNITIRGISTFNGNTSPLIVIDGIPTEMSLNNINPNDIKQITVLKDAASAAIWGVRASNGVIVVTTNSGKKNAKAVVKYSGNFSMESKNTRYTDYYLPTSEFVDAEWDAMGMMFQNSMHTAFSQVGYIYQDYHIEKLSGVSEETAMANARVKLDALKKYDNRKDIEKLFYQNRITQQHNLSISSGADNFTNYLSMTYNGNKGQLKGNTSQRINAINNLSIDITEKLKLKNIIRVVYSKTKNNGVSPSYRPYDRILNEDGSYHRMHKVLHKSEIDAYNNLGFFDWSNNLLEDKNNHDNSVVSKGMSFLLGLSYKITSDLNFSTEFSYAFNNSNSRDVYNNNSYQARDLFNRTTETKVDESKYPTEVVTHHLGQTGGLIYKNYTDSRNVVWRNKLSFKKTFGDIRVNALIGTEHNEHKVSFEKSALIGYNPDVLGYPHFNFQSWLNNEWKGYDGKDVRTYLLDPFAPMDTESVEKYVSYFGTASFTYKDKYDFFCSARLDKTNLLVKASKFRNNPTWSVGGKWKISQEDFYNSKICPDLSIKLSCGISGLMAKNVAPDMTGTKKISAHYAEYNIIRILNPETLNLGWEKTRTLNFGLSGTLFKKLYFDIELYDKNSTGLLANVSLDPSNGWSSMMMNSANVNNKGIDINLNYQIMDSEVNWTAGLNFSYNKNEVTKIAFTPTTDNLTSGNPTLGQPMGVAWAIRYAGLDEYGEPLIMKKGDDTVLGYNELSNFTLDDFVYSGSFNPPVFGSFNTKISYKNFTFNGLVTYKLGHKVRMPAPGTDFWSSMKSKYAGEKYRWIGGVDNTGKMMPKMIPMMANSTNRRYAYRYSDYQLEDGDIVRLKSISLGYDFSKILKSSMFKHASINLSAENLWFWAANRDGLDSDYLSGSSYSTPKPKTYVATLNLKF